VGCTTRARRGTAKGYSQCRIGFQPVNLRGFATAEEAWQAGKRCSGPVFLEGSGGFLGPWFQPVPCQKGELIAETLDLELGPALLVSPFIAVGKLQSAALSLVAGRIRMRRIIAPAYRFRLTSYHPKVASTFATRSDRF
jgi:hypothetical protein